VSKKTKAERLTEKKVKRMIGEYMEWIEGLSPCDRMNFETIVTLPNAKDLINGLPDGKYKEMAAFAWGFVEGMKARDKAKKS